MIETITIVAIIAIVLIAKMALFAIKYSSDSDWEGEQ